MVAIGSFSTTPIDYSSRVIRVAPKTPLAPVPTAPPRLAPTAPPPRGVPAPTDTTPWAVPVVNPIMPVLKTAGDAPPAGPAPTSTSPTGTGTTNTGSTGTSDTGIDRLAGQLATLFNTDTPQQNLAPVNFAPTGETSATPTDSAGGGNKTAAIVMLALLAAGVIYYVKKRGHK